MKSPGSRWHLLSLIWLGVFVALACSLSPSPNHHLPGTGWLKDWKFSDHQTLIALQRHIPPWRSGKYSFLKVGPLAIVDMSTGTADFLSLGRIRGPLSSATWGDYGEFSREWNVIDWSVRGNRVVISLGRGDHDRSAHIVDWRTRQEIFHREVPDSAVRILHDRIWIHPENGTGSLTVVDLETGRELPTRLTGDALHWSDLRISPDGKLVASRLDGEVAVWDVLTETRILTAADARHFGFSQDSRQFVTLSEWRVPPAKEQSRFWRLYDLKTGSMIREQKQQELRDPEKDDLTCGVEIDGAECVCASLDPSVLLRQGRFERVPIDRIDRWDTVTGETHILHPPADAWLWAYGSAGDFEPHEPASLKVRTENEVDGIDSRPINTAPGGSLHRASADRTWGMIYKERKSIEEVLPSWMARIWPRFLETGIRQSIGLYDLRTNWSWMDFDYSQVGVDFTPDGRWFIAEDRNGLRIWSLPLHRPWLKAFCWSLLVPLFWAARLRRQRSVEKLPQKPANPGTIP